ncbi:MAG: hypothetical protein LBJ90_06620 [Treponema sp.]|nr:hypothetical protein [Treponema sp.]
MPDIVNLNENKVNEENLPLLLAPRRLEKFLQGISSLDPDNMTPLEALILLQGLRTEAAALKGEDAPPPPRPVKNRPPQPDKESPGLFD